MRFIITIALLIGGCALARVQFAQEHTQQNEKNPLAGNAAAITAGQRVFEQACQTCHGGEARGSERGPALATGVFKHGGKDGEIFLNIRNGIASTQMPPFKRLSTEQVWQVVSYLRSLSGVPAALTTPRAAGNLALGEQLFFGKANCAACHEVNGRGATIGPDLSNAGRMSAAQLRQKIVDPNTSTTAPARGRRRQPPRGVAVIKTKAGQQLRGLVRNEDTYTLLLTDTNGQLQRLDKAQIAEVNYEPQSLMPADYGQRLSADELQNLVAFLQDCNGRDFSKTIAADMPGGLSYERIRNAPAEPHNWLSYWGDYQGRHYSALKQINTANVAQLQARWAVQMPGDTTLEATPLVIDGVMYTSGMPGQVFALDAKSGLQIWKYERKQKVVNPYESNRFNRGVAVLGQRVFVGTLDAALIALDARTGLPLWEVQVAATMEGYSITSPPLALKDKIIVGVAGGEYGVRGFLDAYDPKTGKRLWRFNAIPGPGEFGNETWKGESWKYGGGATWLTGSYDPELDTLYWTIGNPGPDMNAEIRKGDNLFTCSVVALDPNTGQRKWHYQFTPNDDHDWDANQDVILVDRVWQGQPRKLLIQANRNGFLYVLDRTNGKLLQGTPYVRQTWNAGFEANGRPKFLPNSGATPEGNVVFPSLVGGTNWQAPSYDLNSHWLYLVFNESGERYVRDNAPYEPGKGYWGGRSLPASENNYAGIRALDTTTGAQQWEYKVSQGSLAAGVLATAGEVLFAASREGNLIALAAKTGKPLWRFQTGGTIASAPISYAVDGKQFIALAAGGVLYSFALPE
ncbi:MAG: PQQ-dependent dehydrogenase, methanol/ethanol family [Acidobacteria bacterium]|nr:PQQ-dependent dehydrogenase, methanol/ethanol family [Acidobacteriota bacterium]MBI3428222.1 PQQ-dependent dehydrogenase, methanol/ethanol family [Acidobacteriota bacterium]